MIKTIENNGLKFVKVGPREWVYRRSGYTPDFRFVSKKTAAEDIYNDFIDQFDDYERHKYDRANAPI